MLFSAVLGVQFDLPPGNLSPALPQRMNYVLWVSDLVARTKHMFSTPCAQHGDTTSCISASCGARGIDIGTGASAVFPLLGTSKPPPRFLTCGEVCAVQVPSIVAGSAWVWTLTPLLFNMQRTWFSPMR